MQLKLYTRLKIVVTVVMLVMFGAVGVYDGGRATQAAAEGATPTETKFFVPWLSNGRLNPAVSIRGRELFTGGCAAALSTQRPDAWRCGTADPCFAPFPHPVPPEAPVTTVACAVAPWANEVVLLDLSQPLPTSEACLMLMRGACPEPLNVNIPPWAVELANGARCTITTGAVSPVAGLGVLYGCDDGGQIASPSTEDTFDTTSPQWRAYYLPKDGAVIGQVGVLVVWR